MADTAPERDAVADDAGARAVQFEELGREAAADERTVVGVDSSTIYLGILNELYGTTLPTRARVPTVARRVMARPLRKRVCRHLP